MPIFDYHCDNHECALQGHTLSKMRKPSEVDAPLHCEECGEEMIRHRVYAVPHKFAENKGFKL